MLDNESFDPGHVNEFYVAWEDPHDGGWRVCQFSTRDAARKQAEAIANDTGQEVRLLQAKLLAAWHIPMIKESSNEIATS